MIYVGNPILSIMKKMMTIILYLSIIILLTVFTQIGGLAFLVTLFIVKYFNFRFKKLVVFIFVYLTTTFLIVPLVAPLFGREKIETTSFIKPTNYMTVLLNRNYVVPKMNVVLAESSKVMKQSNIEIHFLDACFPFVDGFPLIPHLSHKDGKKIDLSFVYMTPEKKVANKEKSVSGYGVYVEPIIGEENYAKQCKQQGFWQYGISKYISLGKINDELLFSEKHTKSLISSFANQNVVNKIFIEPNLNKRLKLNHSKIRFHGCHAVRHDDHIHIEIK